MNMDLLFLSYKVAMLVLVGTCMGLFIGWLLRAWKARLEKAHMEAKLDAEHLLRSRLQDQLDQAAKQPAPPPVQDPATEEQIVAALQQRDEAERHATDALNKIRSMQEQLDRALKDAAEKDARISLLQQQSADVDALKARLAELDVQMEKTKAEAAETQALRHQVTELEQRNAAAQREIEAGASLNLRVAELEELVRQTEARLSESSAGKGTEAVAEVSAVAPTAPPKSMRLFAPPVVKPPVPVTETKEEDVFEFPPAPVRPLEDIARHRAPLREGPVPDVARMRELNKEMAALIEKTKPGDKRNLLEARAAFLSENIAQWEKGGVVTDDLTEIRGIKAGIQKQLLELGVSSFQQVSDWSPAALEVVMQLPGIKQRPVKDRWQEQARELLEIKVWQQQR
jgi:predicted flap endonuclease-1-like 5' DNA nuclease